MFPISSARWPGSGRTSTPCDSGTDHQGRCCRRPPCRAAAAAACCRPRKRQCPLQPLGGTRSANTPRQPRRRSRRAATTQTVAMATGRGRPTSVALRCATQSDWLPRTVVMAMKRGRPTSVALRRAAQFDWLSGRNNMRDPDEYTVIRIHLSLSASFSVRFVSASFSVRFVCDDHQGASIS